MQIRAHRFKSYAAQIIAVSIKNLMTFNIGITLTYTEILLAALTGQNEELNPNETIRLKPEQASWLGSIGFAAQVVGSIFSGYLGEALGRKKSLILMNIPHLIGWLLFYSAKSMPQFYIAASLFGFGIGSINGPSTVYAGEISDISIRGIITSASGIIISCGILIVYILGNLADWRTIALYCAIFPILSFIALLFMPETPVWLLSKNREKEALESLCWLRGWTSEEAVQEEFDSLKKYRDHSNACDECQRAGTKCTHPLPTLMDRFNAMFKANCMRPLIIFTVCSIFTNFAGLHHIFPYTVQILNTFNCPFNPNKAIIWFGVTNILSSIGFTFVIKLAGKRTLYFSSLMGMAICSLSLGIYAILQFSSSIRSFDYENLMTSTGNGSIFPLLVIICAKALTAGLLEVPFMYTSELFPLKARCFAAGMCSAIFNLILFITTTSFYNMEMWFGLPYTLCIYGVSGIFAIIALYRILPHTENVSLADIERHFSRKDYKWTDWKIAKSNYAE